MQPGQQETHTLVPNHHDGDQFGPGSVAGMNHVLQTRICSNTTPYVHMCTGTQTLPTFSPQPERLPCPVCLPQHTYTHVYLLFVCLLVVVIDVQRFTFVFAYLP